MRWKIRHILFVRQLGQNFLILNLTEHETCPAHKCSSDNIVDILRYISRINIQYGCIK